MPTQIVQVYPGNSYDLSFGGEATAGWATAPTPANVNDAKGAPNDATFGLWQPSQTLDLDCYAEYKAAIIPSGVTITRIRMYARVLGTGTSEVYDFTVAGILRPSGAGGGSSGSYEYGSPVTITAEDEAAEVYHDELIGEWTTNPATSIAFTLTDLASMAWGAHFHCDAVTVDVNNANIRLSQIYLEVEVVSIAGGFDPVRQQGSDYLRTFGRNVRRVRITGPALLADAEIGETVFLDHADWPTPDGLGAGAAVWARRPFLVLADPTDEIGGRVTLEGIDLRMAYATWWSPLRTNLGHSIEGQGIPVRHSGGGGLIVDRGASKFVERPGNPTDRIVMATPNDLPAYDHLGLVVEGEQANLVLNSTFSQGTGDSFDSWSSVVTGTGEVKETTLAAPADPRRPFDVDGLRRAAWVRVGATDASEAYVEQDIGVSSAWRIAIRYLTMFGAAKFGFQIQRASDSFYWDDTAGAWTATITTNHFAQTLSLIDRHHSKLISNAGADTITIRVGYFAEAGSEDFEGLVGGVDVVEGTPTHIGTDIPTTVSPVSRASDLVWTPNNEVGRVIRRERGSITIGVIPQWNGADLATFGNTGIVKTILNVDSGLDDDFDSWFHVFYKGQGNVEGDVFPAQWIFRLRVGGVDYDAYLEGHDPVRGVLQKVTVRWTGTDGELELVAAEGDGTYLPFHNIAVDNEWGTGLTIPDYPSIGPTGTVYVGHTVDEIDAWDGELRHLDMVDICLTDEELERRAY